MDWLTAYKIPLGSWIKSLVDLLNAHAAGFFDFISWALGGLIDGMTAGSHRRPAAPAAGPDRAARLAAAPLLAAGGPGRRLAAADHQSRLLAGDAGDPGAGRLGHRHVHADRRPARHHGGAPARASTPCPAAGPRPDADHPDLRLPDPDPDPVRARRGAGPDLDRDLRPAGADPADLSGRQPRAACR